MSGKKAIVTGGAGFIGSHICDALIERGIEVAVIDNLSSGKKQNLAPDAAFYEVDIRDESVRDIFAKEKPNCLFHLAAQMDVRKSVADPMYDASVNIGGTANLLEAGRAGGLEKTIYAATGGAMYGEPKVLPADENTPIEPLCPYGISKGAAEHYLELYRKLYGMNYTSLRFPNVYGPRQDPHGEAGVVAIFSQLMLSGKRPKIFGDGTMTRDYVYVGDVVEANMLALDNGGGMAMNLGRGTEITVQQIFDGVRDAVGCDIEPDYVPERLGEVAHISLDASLAKKTLGWEPKVELLDGLARAVDFYRRLNAGEITR
ncbi:MAG: NAD-dependent epimerase/dehydratase family protein [Planctomycetota bacterium]